MTGSAHLTSGDACLSDSLPGAATTKVGDAAADGTSSGGAGKPAARDRPMHVTTWCIGCSCNGAVPDSSGAAAGDVVIVICGRTVP
mmetsp:Transcript_2654/g.6560  ORF Transcript_2654/g.6560 Transcript_2654/m.6560 type:complete len:86 (-) Transcript_2654:258-515(-)